MFKYLTLAWHRLTSTSVGEYLGKALLTVENDFEAAKNAVHDEWEYGTGSVNGMMKRASAAYQRDIAALEDLAEFELAKIEYEVELLRARAAALLDAGVAVGERTIDALCLHAHLQNAMAKATPQVKV